jgi:hypothetical protein
LWFFEEASMRIKWLSNLPALIACTLLAASLSQLSAQVATGRISGRVTDATGAVLAGASVTITNDATGVPQTVRSGATGDYLFEAVNPGSYSLTADAPGFKQFLSNGIQAHIQDNLTVDIKLALGTVGQQVTVSSAAPLLQTADASVGQTVTEEQVNNLPLQSRDWTTLGLLASGTSTTGSANNSEFNVSGVDWTQNDFRLDGIDDNVEIYGAGPISGASGNNGYTAIVPPPDAIQEFKLQSGNFSAEFGHSTGGIVNAALKSGSNSLHGDLWEYVRNTVFNANDYFANQSGTPRPAYHQNQFGGTAGGPVYLPKLYNGKNKTFFFVAYEGLRRVQGASTYYTVPTARERTGDFSQTHSLVTVNGITTAVPVNIYLPLPSTTTTTQVSPGNFQLNRQQATYNGVANVIPPQDINPTAAKLVSLFPLPNITPVNADGTLNYFTNAPTRTRTDQWIVKLDHTFSDTKKAFFRWTTDWTLSNPPNIFAATNPAANNNGPTTQFNPSFTLGYTWTLSPRDILEFRANLTRINLILEPIGGVNYDLQGLGFAANELVGIPTSAFPGITDGSYPAMGLGSFVLRNNHSSVYSVTPNYTKIVNNWTLKFGGEYEDILYNFTQPYKASLIFNSTAQTFTQPCSGTGCPAVAANIVNGSTAANFLLGAADGGIGSGQYTTGDPTEALKNGFYGFYSQNDWKATRNLTLNLGARWEFQGPLTDRYNRLSQFNLNTTNETGTAGLYQFSGVGGNPRGQTNTNWKNWAPRIGLAYRIGEKTVIRAAYGISYVMITGVGSGAQGFGSDGFSAPAYVQIRPNSGLDILQSPFNNAYSSGGVTANANPNNPVLLGQNVTAIIRNDSQIPYIQQWNFTIQRELPFGLLLQTAYVGTKGTHLAIQQEPVNQADDIPQSTLTSAVNSYVATGTNPLTTLVPNPFYGVITNNTNLKNPTIQQQYLDFPYPAYGTVVRFQDRTGSSTYNALQITMKRAFSHGFQIMGTYTWSKSIDFGGAYTAQVQTGSSQGALFWDPTNMRLDRSVSAFDQTQRSVISYVWELPFGKGRQFLSSTPVVSQVVGGWKIGGITTFAQGFPIGITGTGFGRPNLIADPTLPSKDQIIGDGHTAITLPTGQSIVVPAGYKLIFNPDAFSAPVLTVPKAGSPGVTVNVANPYYYGNSPRLFDSLRGPGINNFDLTLSRTFALKERLKLDARLDAFNAFNRVQAGLPATGFGGPNLTTPGSIGLNTSSTFGTINTQTIQTAVGSNTNIPRYLQVSMRLYW